MYKNFPFDTSKLFTTMSSSNNLTIPFLEVFSAPFPAITTTSSHHGITSVDVHLYTHHTRDDLPDANHLTKLVNDMHDPHLSTTINPFLNMSSSFYALYHTFLHNSSLVLLTKYIHPIQRDIKGYLFAWVSRRFRLIFLKTYFYHILPHFLLFSFGQKSWFHFVFSFFSYWRKLLSHWICLDWRK